MKTLTRIVAVCAIGAVALVGKARADISVTAQIDPAAVQVGNQARLTITVHGKFRKTSQPELPQLDRVEIYQSGTSQSFSIVNGRRDVSLVFTYVLIPQQEGRFKIAPITFETDDGTYTANPVTLEAVKAQSHLPPPTAPPTADLDSEDAPIFIRASVDRDTVYVNQQITWQMGFYTDGRIDLLRSPQFSPPSAEGFWVEDLPPQKNYYQQIKGRRYLVNEIIRGYFPAAPGQYTIGPAQIDIVLDDFSGRSTFDNFFNLRRPGFGFGKSRKLTTDPITITVLPLPAQGKPSSFSGLVGRGLQMSLKTDKNTVRAGEPVSVTLEITGDGNFKTMAAPKVPDIQGFKMYESGSTSELYKNNYQVTGRKITNFVLIPRDEGEAVIPAVEVSYFDPYEKRYRTIRSDPLRLRVTPGEQGEGGAQVVFTGSGEDIEVLGHDIHHIHSVPGEMSMAGTPFYESPIFVALNSLPLLAVALSLLVERRRRRWRDDVPMARARRALREADRRLDAARELARRGQVEGAFAGASAALRGYLADKMNASAAGLTEGDIDAYLAGKGIDTEGRREVHSALATCDGARYSAAGASADAAEQMLKEARRLVRSLEAGLAV